MAITVSSRDFNRDVSAAKRATADGPVVITDRGAPSHVLLSYAQFEDLRAHRRNLAEILRMDTAEDIAFDPGRVDMTPRPVDL